LRQQWEIQDRQIVGYVGSLSLTSHAVDLLLEGFRQLTSQRGNLVLLVVGGGEDFDTVRKLASTKGLDRSVRFVGRIPPTETPAYYAMADVTVDPVKDDLVARARSPLKIVESLAVGTPVVTGDVGDRRQMLADEQAGVLVTPGDPEALAAGLAQVLDNPDLAQRLSHGALAQREHFYWDRLVDQVIQLYEGAGNKL
jgi:glycosyltransferase involved in cell wall biosynthesis